MVHEFHRQSTMLEGRNKAELPQIFQNVRHKPLGSTKSERNQEESGRNRL
jgi:hypothetical protein